MWFVSTNELYTTENTKAHMQCRSRDFSPSPQIDLKRLICNLYNNLDHVQEIKHDTAATSESVTTKGMQYLPTRGELKSKGLITTSDRGISVTRKTRFVYRGSQDHKLTHALRTRKNNPVVGMFLPPLLFYQI